MSALANDCFCHFLNLKDLALKHITITKIDPISTELSIFYSRGEIQEKNGYNLVQRLQKLAQNAITKTSPVQMRQLKLLKQALPGKALDRGALNHVCMKHDLASNNLV